MPTTRTRLAKIQTVTPTQMALDIFEDLAPQGLSITDASREIAFRKSNKFIVAVTDLSLLARKALNVMYYLASTSPDDVAEYNFDASFFCWLLDYDSRDLKFLRKVLRSTQQAAIEVEAGEGAALDWRSIPLMGANGIRGGRVVFKIDDLLRPFLKADRAYTHLSVRISSGFTSAYALALYELCSMDAYRAQTRWMTIDEFRRLIGAVNKSYDQFKELKRAVIDPAVQQINELSDRFIRYETQLEHTQPQDPTRTGRGGARRKIGEIRFHIADNPQGKYALRVGDIELRAQTYTTLVDEFGLGSAQIAEIMDNRTEWTDDRIREAVEFTRHRMTTGSVKAPGLYFMKALRERLRISKAEAQPTARLRAQPTSQQNAQLKLLTNDGVAGEGRAELSATSLASQKDAATLARRQAKTPETSKVVSDAAQGAALTLATLNVPDELLVALRDDFGLSAAQLTQIAARRTEWTDERLKEAMEFVKRRATGGTVKRPGLYLLAVLRDQLRLGRFEQVFSPMPASVSNTPVADPGNARQIETQRAAKLAADAEHALAVFATLTEEERTQVIIQFRRAPGVKTFLRAAGVSADAPDATLQSDERARSVLGTYLASKPEFKA